MGKGASKHEERRSRLQENSDPRYIENSDQMAEERDIERLRNEFNNDTDMFLLNNILLSVMFFENYERQIKETIHKKIDRNLNMQLLKEHQLSCLRPNQILELVDKNVRFRCHHGPRKKISEALLPRRLFILHDNIEISISGKDNHYSGIDNNIYKAELENSDKKGYVELRYIKEGSFKPSSSRSSTSTNTSDSDSPIQRKSDDSDTYDDIINARTPKLLDDTRATRTNYSSNFIIVNEVKNLNVEDDDEVLFKTEYKLDSKVLMKHFQNKQFQYKISEAVGFRKEIIDEATGNNSNIFYRVREEDYEVHWEVIPAVSIPFPDEQTFEWSKRSDRKEIWDNVLQRKYQWPSNKMMSSVRSKNALVLPKGCTPKKGKNPREHFQWELCFPKQEVYLESMLSHTQLRAYFFLNTLYKTYIEPITQKKGLLPEHLRNHIFWECESNCYEWPELRLGNKLMLIIDNLHDHLARFKFPDYFIREKNLFENIPGMFLREAQRKLNDIRQTPVMHFILALRNLRYTTENFYPITDFAKLYEILKEDEEVHPAMTVVRRSDPEPVRPISQPSLDPERDWKRRYYENKRKQRLEKEKVVETKKAVEKTNIRRESTDSINLRWTSKCLNQSSRVYSQSLILKFFLDHFIEIAERSHRMQAHKQSLLYLKQSFYLAKILEDNQNFIEDADNYKEKINKLRMKVTLELERLEDVDGPILPYRNTNSFNFPNTLKLKEGTVQRIKLQKNRDKPGPTKNWSSSAATLEDGVVLRNEDPNEKVTFDMENITVI